MAAAISVDSHQPGCVCAAQWGSHLFRYCAKNDFGKGIGHLGDTIGLGGRGRNFGEALLNYLLSAICVVSKLLPIERPDLCFRSHVPVGCGTTAKANHRVYDVMV